LKKVAIFVEGMTEQEFAVRLVSALVGNKGLHVILGRQWKGKVTITPSITTGEINFYILIIDCANDGQVKTQIREEYPSLMAAGYTAIIGLRDVYPHLRTEISLIQKHLSKGLPAGPVTPQMYLAVMEVEAWFVGETTHFARVDHALTVPFIVESGFDIVGNLADSWQHPAKVLDEIYRLVNKKYVDLRGQKRKRRVMRTINALSLEELYISVRKQLPAFDAFLTSIEGALF
jgi:hypothetical protein